MVAIPAIAVGIRNRPARDLPTPLQPKLIQNSPPKVITARNAKHLRFSEVRASAGGFAERPGTNEFVSDDWEVAALSPDGKLAALTIGRRWLHIVDLANGKPIASHLSDAFDFYAPNVALTNDGVAAWSRGESPNFRDAAIGILTPNNNSGQTKFLRCPGIETAAPGSTNGRLVAFSSFSPTGSVTCVVDLDRRKIVERRVGGERIAKNGFPSVPLKSFQAFSAPTFFDRQPLKRKIWLTPAPWTDRFGDSTDGFEPSTGGYSDESGRLVRPFETPFRSAGKYAVVERDGALDIVNLATRKRTNSVAGTRPPPVAKPSRLRVKETANSRSITIAIDGGQTRRLPDGVWRISQSRDQTLVAWRDEGTITFVDTHTGQTKTFPIDGPFSFGPVGKSSIILLSGGRYLTTIDRLVVKRDSLQPSGRLVERIGGDDRNIAVSPDGSLFALDRRELIQGGVLDIFEVKTGARVASLQGKSNVNFFQTGLEFSDDGTELRLGDYRMEAVLIVK
jgi:hypothetical protein